MSEFGVRAPRRYGRRSTAARARLAGAVVLALATGAACSAEGTVAPPPAGCVIPASVIAAGHTVVEVRGYEFSPALVRVSPGETVTWVNCEPPDADEHNAVSDAGLWASEYFSAGDYVSMTFDSAGSFLYHCEPHPLMKGTVQVE